jgi:ribonuclease D
MTYDVYDMSELPQQLVGTADEFAACCDHLAACPAFGFDTEFIGEESYHPHLCLIQVATPERLYLIDPLAADTGPLDRFWEMVADPGRTVVVHAGREEIRMCQLGCGRPPGQLFDIQLAAGLVGLGFPTGHGPLVSKLFGVQLAKAETLTDWSRRPLTKQQIQYAYDDVRYLLGLWQKLSRKLTRLGRTEWAAEEFRTLAHKAMLENPAVERWRKLRGIGGLDRRRLAVVRELFAWREEVAERQNRPARTVVRDDLLVEVARRLPQKERDLSVLRGLPKFDLPGILRAVQRGRDLPGEDLPMSIERDNDPSQVNLVTGLMMAALSDFCGRRSLSQGIVATNSDVRHLVRAKYFGTEPADECGLLRGWRREYVLPELLAVLEGKRAVRVGDVRSASPLEWLPTDGTVVGGSSDDRDEAAADPS